MEKESYLAKALVESNASNSINNLYGVPEVIAYKALFPVEMFSTN